ncbi:EscU/YscU/HrcU family type III secretion system export apparatus switch protein [Ornithinibacillus californiensis]|uniref:EscU/YscU/HrcU family type III secretion system export apparatus switch protein n=1 Tax=Ornithinibacillus californiensis TaxID=161536 RepID=UPI00064D8F9B|nr:EscU/YscU/HrcU family type III secretion system export apparatus switch protein [Ornithinibacillus californiensis]
MNHNRKKAIALSYDQEKADAPKVSATGKGLIAENIIKKAKENHIPIMEDRNMVELLSKLDINEKVPEELYQAVAEVFAFIYRTDQKMDQNK